MENLYNWIDNIIASADGLSFVAGVLCGLVWRRFAPAVRAFVAKTPTKFDDLIINAAEACSGMDRDKDLCAEELNKVLTNIEIVKLVQLRKADIMKKKKAQQDKGGAEDQ